MKYGEWINVWLENYVRTSSKERTYRQYKKICSLHIVGRLGEKEISELTVTVLQDFVTECLAHGNLKNGEGLSSGFVNLIISVIQSSLGTARLAGLVSENEGSKIKRPRKCEKRVEGFSVYEQRKIEECILRGKTDKRLGIVLCLYTGLRIGELLALEWSDVDLKRNLLTVSKCCYDASVNGAYTRITDTPKTQSSVRVIPFPRQLSTVLKALKLESRSNYVISENGKPIFVRSYQRTFELLLKKLDIPHRGFHSLRHTFATRALECGMDVKTLSEILGHRSATVTLNRYAHSFLEHKVNMMNRLGGLLLQ